MFEKYLKIIQDSKDNHNKIEDFLQNLNIIDCNIDIIGNDVIFKINALDMFIFEENKEKIICFLKENNLNLKEF